MRIPLPRLMWSAAVAILIALIITRGNVDATALPALLLVALLAFLTWPVIAARFPPGYTLSVTLGGLALAGLLGLAYAVVATLQSGAPVAVASVTLRLVGATLSVLAIAVVFSVLGAILWPKGWPAGR